MPSDTRASLLDLARAAAKLATTAASHAGAAAKDAVPKSNPAPRVLGTVAQTAASVAQKGQSFASEVSQRVTEERIQQEEFLKARGWWPNESEIEDHLKASYHGGHPDLTAALDYGELYITKTRLIWVRATDGFAIPYEQVVGMDLDHYNPSAMRNLLLGPSRVDTVRNRVVVHCVINGAEADVRFEFREALTVTGNEAVARKFLALMAPHRAAFARPAAATPAAPVAPAPAASTAGTADELAKFADLFAKGLLTEEEFRAVKARLLGL